MPTRSLPRPLPRGTRWAVPVGVGVAVAAGGLANSVTAPLAGSAPPVLAVTSVLLAALIGAQVGAVLLVRAAPVAAAWLAVAAGAAQLTYDMPGWVLVAVGLGAVGALALQLHASVARRALESWPRSVTTGPPPEVTALLPAAGRRDAVALTIALGGAALVVLGALWTAHDVRAVTEFRAAALADVGRVVHVDEEGFAVTVEVAGTSVVAPVTRGAPEVGSSVAVRWSPQTSRAELLGDAFDPAGALIWSGIGLCALVVAWRRSRRLQRLAQAGRAATLESLVLTARTRGDGITLVDTDGTPRGTLRYEQFYLSQPGPGVGADDRPSALDELVRDDRDVAELTDAEVILRNRAVADAVREVVGDDTDDDPFVLLDLLPPLAPAHLVVLDDAPVDRPVLAHVGDVWFAATLTGLRPTDDGAAPPAEPAPRRSEPTVPSSSPEAPPGDHAGGAPHDPDQGSPATGLLPARVHQLLGRSDALLLLPLHAAGALLAWWVLSDPTTSVIDVVRTAITVSFVLSFTARPRALVRVRPRYLELRGWLWDAWVPWRQIEHVGHVEDALVLRRSRRGSQDALVLERPAGATWAFASFVDDDATARRLVTEAWAAGRHGPGPLLPGRPSLGLLLTAGWVALFVAALLR